jgi:hypothetical protein
MQHVNVLTLFTSGTLAISCTAAALSTPLTIRFQANGEETLVFTGEPVQQFGDFSQYVGLYADPDGRWSVSWNYWVNPNPEEGASMVGNSQVKNFTNDTVDFKLILTSPLCPVLPENSLLGAFIVVSLQSNADGGMMTNFDGKSIWAVMADGQQARTVFDSPFVLSSTGTGTATLTSSFGTPFPSEPSGPFTESLGLRHQFRMTPGDTGTFQTSLYLGSNDQNFVDCSNLPGDLNGDGVVDVQDLLILISAWGPCGNPDGCPSDLDGDGVVNVVDMMLLFTYWTN